MPNQLFLVTLILGSFRGLLALIMKVQSPLRSPLKSNEFPVILSNYQYKLVIPLFTASLRVTSGVETNSTKICANSSKIDEYQLASTLTYCCVLFPRVPGGPTGSFLRRFGEFVPGEGHPQLDLVVALRSQNSN